MTKLTVAERVKRYRQTEKGRAWKKSWDQAPEQRAKAKAHYEANKERIKAYRDSRKEITRHYNAKRFVQFKKALVTRIECLRHTSPAFREARIQEILDWAGSSHSYWVESEIQNACA